MGGDTVTVSLYSGHGSGLDGFGQPVRFIWADFQAKPSILDPFWTKFDVFGTYRNFGWDLTSPVLLCTIPAGAFFPVKMTTLGFDKPCAAGYYSRRGFFSAKMTTLGFQHWRSGGRQ